MTCPVCNGETSVIDCHKETDHIWRRRRCRECGYRFNTIETDEDIYLRLEKGKKNERKHD